MQNLGYSSIFWGNAFAFQRKELKYKSHYPKTVAGEITVSPICDLFLELVANDRPYQYAPGEDQLPDRHEDQLPYRFQEPDYQCLG